MHKVSVILPLYNADIRCLGDCIKSIQAQTLSDFECIFVNDGSPTRECIEYAVLKTRDDSRFKLVEKANGGLASARNFGFRHSKGGYITFVDQDDILHPQRLELAINAMEAMNADVCECKVSRPSFRETFKAQSYPFHKATEVQNTAILLKGSDILKWYLAQKMNITVWSHVYRRQIIEDYPLPVSVWGCDDLAYNIVNANRIKSLVKIAQPLYFWRRNPKATTGRVPYAYMEGVVQAIEYVKSYYCNHTLSDEIEQMLTRYLACTFVDVMRDVLQVKRNGTECVGLVGLSQKTNALLDGGVIDNVDAEDKCWVQRLLDGDFKIAVSLAKTALAKRMRRGKLTQIKRFVKRIVSRKQ